MPSVMSLVFIVKLSLVPLLIAGITLAGRRWGPAVAGWLSAFPVVAGPILCFMALEQGPAFAAAAAKGTLAAVLAILAFGVAYAWTATRHGWLGSLAAGFAAYAAAVSALSRGTPPLWLGAPAVLAALMLAPRLYPRAASPGRCGSTQGNDLPPRMLAGALLVCAVTHFAPRLGPGLSGVLAMFPVMGSVLVVFSHRRDGAAFAIHLLRGMVLGYYAFSAFCLVLALALPSTGIVTGFSGALAAATVVQALSRVLLNTRHRPVSAPASMVVSPLPPPSPRGG